MCIYLPSPSEAKGKPFTGYHMGRVAFATLVAIFVAGANAIDIFLEWNVALDNTIQPVPLKQPV